MKAILLKNNVGEKKRHFEILSTVQLIVESTPDIQFFIPAVTAVQNSRNSKIGDNICNDRYHLNQLGKYTIACSWFEKITGINVLDDTVTPKNLNNHQRQLAQHSAHFAILRPNKIIQMNDFIEDLEEENTYELQH